MKKWISLVLILLVAMSCLAGCNFSQNVSGALAGKTEVTSKAEEMLAALADNCIADAQDLLHPEERDEAADALAQLVDYIDGRETAKLELTNIHVQSSVGTSGTVKQETVSYRVTLTDNSVFSIHTVYLTDMRGSGFSVFQLVLGVN